MAGWPVRGYENYLSERIVPFPKLLQEAGIIPLASKLPPRDDTITRWEDLRSKRKKREARKMEPRFDESDFELFDLRNGPGETTSLQMPNRRNLPKWLLVACGTEKTLDYSTAGFVKTAARNRGETPLPQNLRRRRLAAIAKTPAQARTFSYMDQAN